MSLHKNHQASPTPLLQNVEQPSVFLFKKKKKKKKKNVSNA